MIFMILVRLIFYFPLENKVSNIAGIIKIIIISVKKNKIKIFHNSPNSKLSIIAVEFELEISRLDGNL